MGGTAQLVSTEAPLRFYSLTYERGGGPKTPAPRVASELSSANLGDDVLSCSAECRLSRSRICTLEHVGPRSTEVTPYRAHFGDVRHWHATLAGSSELLQQRIGDLRCGIGVGWCTTVLRRLLRLSASGHHVAAHQITCLALYAVGFGELRHHETLYAEERH